MTIGGHAPFPTVTNHGVPAMTAPKIVALTFNNDSNESTIQSYVSSLGTTAWWGTVLKDYSVGPATGQTIPLTATLASSYTDDPSGTLPNGGTPTMPGFVVSTVQGNASIPKPDDQTIYVFFMPSTTTFELQGQTSCQAVGGYHNSTTSNGTTYVYAVIPECASATFGDRTFASEIDLLSFLSSHEISEAATDPTASLTSASFTAGWYNDFVDDPVDDYAWNLVSDGEVADFCVDQFGIESHNDETTDGNTVLQRIWSTSAAAAGKNPCLPVPSGEVYFNAAPAEGTDLVIVPDVNQAATVEVDAFSDSAMSWKVLALDGSLAQGMAAELTMSFQGGAPEAQAGLSIGSIPGIGVNQGSKVTLSVTLLASLSTTNPFAPGFLISHDGPSLAGATSDHYWPLAVTTEAIAQQFGLTSQSHVILHRQSRPAWPALLRVK
jgi:hypothetical protein